MSNIDLALEGYLEAVLFAEVEEMSDPTSPVYDRSWNDRGYAREDFDEQDIIEARRQLELFIRLAQERGLLLYPDVDWHQVGADLYFTRQRHGVGFWDRPELYHGEGDDLTAIVGDNFCEIYTFMNDRDEKICIEGRLKHENHSA